MYEATTKQDRKPQAAAQRQAKHKALPLNGEKSIQRKPNNTGLPDNLKAGIENLSGYSMDDVKVHYNSPKPATLQAHAYAQGTDIHLASGQERHLPHEAWHVVQQKQGRVRPTMQMKGNVNINDDAGLEKEADVMGGRASRGIRASIRHQLTQQTQPIQRKSIIQLVARVLTDQEWQQMQNAKTAAQLLLANAINPNNQVFILMVREYLNVRPTDSRLRHYRAFLQDISLTIAGLGRGNFRYDPNDNDYAYVDPEDANHILTVGNAFWNAPLVGVNSQAGTLIHEVTHWIDVRGTDDHEYGNDDDSDYDSDSNDSLKKLSSVRARNNADTWERIIEKS